MPIPDVDTAVKYSFLSFAGMGLLTWLARFLMKSYRTEKLANVVNDADISGYDRLEKEVKRLGRKCAAMEKALKLLCDVEIEGAADMGMLTVHIANMPCGKCGAPSDTFHHINTIIERMVERRKFKMQLLQEDYNQ
jgi:hypothetical protein